MPAENGADHFLDGGLAVAARHRDDRQLETPAPHAGKVAQGLTRIGDMHLRQIDGLSLLDDDTGRTGGSRMGGKFGRVVAHTTQGEKQLPRFQAAGIGAHRIKTCIGADQGTADRLCNHAELAHAHAPCPCCAPDRAAAATARSEKGRLTPATVCVCSWPLPAIRITSSEAAEWMAR
jgi:hypothetical protein